ncbi:MAG: hypothetical protein ABEJ68_06935 [Halobacteriaceae archaeon]
MAFRDLMRRLLVADIALGVLLALSTVGILVTGARLTSATRVVIQLCAGLIVLNFLLVSAVLYSDWEPV